MNPDAKQTGRKSSLTLSLQKFANRTFYSIPRKISDATVAATQTQRHVSTPFKGPKSPSKLPVPRSRLTSSTIAARVPLPRSATISGLSAPPPSSTRGSGSRIPTLGRISSDEQQDKAHPGVGSHTATKTVSSRVREDLPIPQPKPFVGYQDIKSLITSGAVKSRRPDPLDLRAENGTGSEAEEVIASARRRAHATSSKGKEQQVATRGCIRTSGTSMARSMSMAAIAPSHKTSADFSFHHFPTTTGHRIGPLDGRESGARSRKSDCTAADNEQAVNHGLGVVSIRPDPKDRDLPLPPIPTLPKSYSIGKITIDGRVEKTHNPPKMVLPAQAPSFQPLAIEEQTNKQPNTGNTSGALKPTKIISEFRPKTAIEDCYITAKHFSAPAEITEPLIDLTPTRRMRTSGPDCVIPDVSEDPSPQTCEQLPKNVQLVVKSQPHQYWLGRFSTIVSSLQYEEAFEEPDPFIGHRAPSRIKFLRTCGLESAEEFNAKRAFSALERVCMTAEATKSFHEFRDAYERRHLRSKALRVFKSGANPETGRRTVIRGDENVER